MFPYSRVFIAAAAGAAAGALVLGVGGRLLMAALPLLAGRRPGFSVGGSLEVVAVGVGYGAVGGLLLLALRRVVGTGRIPAGVWTGLVLFALAWLTSRAGRGAASGLGDTLPLVLGVAALAFVGYGIVAERLLVCWSVERTTVVQETR